MYIRALERKKEGAKFNDLGEVIGVDIPYEENPSAEIIIDSSKDSAEQNALTIKKALYRYLKL
jgi:adenylylsulfate kinase